MVSFYFREVGRMAEKKPSAGKVAILHGLVITS